MGYLEKGHITNEVSCDERGRGEGNETRRGRRLTLFKEKRSEL